MIRVSAKIKSKSSDIEWKEWKEYFDVTSLETAEEEIKSIIDNFNNTIKKGETPREIAGIIEEYKIESSDQYYDEAHRFLRKVHREAYNAYGSPWCKSKEDNVEKAIANLHKKGGLARFKKLVHDSPFDEEFQHLTVYNPIEI